jgi:hypothetical protein
MAELELSSIIANLHI